MKHIYKSLYCLDDLIINQCIYGEELKCLDVEIYEVLKVFLLECFEEENIIQILKIDNMSFEVYKQFTQFTIEKKGNCYNYSTYFEKKFTLNNKNNFVLHIIREGENSGHLLNVVCVDVGYIIIDGLALVKPNIDENIRNVSEMLKSSNPFQGIYMFQEINDFLKYYAIKYMKRSSSCSFVRIEKLENILGFNLEENCGMYLTNSKECEIIPYFSKKIKIFKTLPPIDSVKPHQLKTIID